MTKEFNFLKFPFLMVMKHFIGSHNSGLRKNAYVEKTLKKNQSY